MSNLSNCPEDCFDNYLSSEDDDYTPSEQSDDTMSIDFEEFPMEIQELKRPLCSEE